MTIEELAAYRPGEVDERAEPLDRAPVAEARRQAAWCVARQAAQILYDRFGASKVLVFGSLSQGGAFTRWSDIDLAAWGIPADRFYQAVAAVTGLSADFKVDLIDPETCRPAIRDVLTREGVAL